MKRQTTNWEKIFAKHISDKGLLDPEQIKNFQNTVKQIVPLKNGQATYTDSSLRESL